MSQIYKFVFTFCIFLCSLQIAAQIKVGVIKDCDGFVNVREGAATEFSVLAKI